MPVRRLLALLLVGLAAGMVIVGDVQAQQERQRQDRGQRGPRRGGFGRGRGGFGGGPLLGLTRAPEVREEIKLTEDQIELVDILRDDLEDAEGRPEFPENFRDLSDEERTAFFEKMRTWGEQQAAKAKESLAVVLEEDQFKRLNEISIQVQGVQALLDPDVAKELKLSKEQQQQVEEKQREARSEMFAQMREIFQGGDREAAREKMEALRKESDAKVLAVLAEEQKQAFEKMKGEPFEMRSPFGGGRGRRGGGDRPDRPQRPE